MRWFSVTTAKISPETRETLEQYGPDTLRTLLLIRTFVLETPKGRRFTVDDIRGELLLWLKEQLDREERRETWLMTMEFSVTLFVLFELLISVAGLFRK
jgi:hypothetical protein